MAETSRPWPGTVLGDCGPYSATQWDDAWENMFTQDNSDTEGVLPGVLNELEVTNPAANTARVATGAALVKGKYYGNSANVDVNIPTPSSDTRIDRIVLRSLWSAQTVRVTRIAGTEGAGVPAITQVDGNTWDLTLAQVEITTSGAITITDEREYCHYATRVSTAMLDDGVLSADATGRGKMADGFFANGVASRAKFADAFLQANADGRRLMGNGYVNVDKLANGIDAQPKTFNADTVDGYHAADLLAGGVIEGAIIMWFGTLGGTDGHRPVVSGVPNEDWHLCNGETVNGHVTPDMQGRLPLGVGGGVGASKGDTSGNETLDLAHTHGPGTYTTVDHAHDAGTLQTDAHSHAIPGGGDIAAGSTYSFLTDTEPALGVTGTVAASGPLTVTAGASASGLGVKNIMNPYLALYFLMKVA